VLDAYIIEKIRRDQDEAHSERQPARIPMPRYPEPRRRPWNEPTPDEQPSDRGVVIIDM
jgi:hypothetical protein